MHVFKKVGFRYITFLGAVENPIYKSAHSEVMRKRRGLTVSHRQEQS